MPRFLSLVLILLLAGAASGRIELDRLHAEKRSSDIVLTWTAKTEDDVTEYVIRRQSSASDGFIVLEPAIPARGSGTSYTFTDQTVFKAHSEMEVIRYQLHAVFAGDRSDVQVFEFAPVSYQPTAVRRTWGSIKAMFQ